MYDYAPPPRGDRYRQRSPSPRRFDARRRSPSPRFEPRHASKYGGYDSKYGNKRDGYHSKQDYHGRDYKGKWVTSRANRFDEASRSRSPSPGYRGDADGNEMAGLIFMCNKKTQRRCLTYHVLGMPMTKKHLVSKVMPGMKLFLFEFESRQLYGIFEAVSEAQMDLEPKAFLDAGIDFPMQLQVRFRILEKCPPLREVHFKDAIASNYFEANRFRFELSRNQVNRLLKLFAPPEKSYDSPRNIKSLRSPYPEDRKPRDYREYSDAGRNHGYGSRREISSPEVVTKKPVYVENRRPSPQRIAPPSDYAIDRGTDGYEAEYKQGRYHTTVKHRYEADGWPNTVDTIPTSSIHHAAPAAPAYSTLPSKYDTVGTYATLGRAAELPTLPSLAAAERYYDNSLQLPPDPYSLKPGSLYGRQGIPAYGDAGGRYLDPVAEDAALRLAGKRALVNMDYIPITTTREGFTSIQALGSGRDVDYGTTVPGYGSDLRRLPLGYADSGIDSLPKQQARYGYASGLPLREEVTYPGPAAVMSVPAVASGAASFGDRYAREPSPPLRYNTATDDSRYAAAPSSYKGSTYTKADRHEKNDDERYTRTYEREEPAVKTGHRRAATASPEKYVEESPEKNPSRTSVWERVSGIEIPRGRGRVYEEDNNGGEHYTTFNKSFHKSFQKPFNKRPREVDIEFPQAGEEAGFQIDFKRRNKGTEVRPGPNQNGLQRKRRFVRPDDH